MDRSPDSEDDDPPAAGPRWRVDVDASRVRLAHDPAPLDPRDGGSLVFTDEHGRQRRLPANMSELTSAEIAAAADAMSAELGSMRGCNRAQTMALQHLDRLHDSGAMSDADFERERKRLLDYG